MTDTTAAVRNNPALSRFELDVEDGIAVIDYHAAPGVLTFYHTEVPPQLRGRGIAARLVQEALQQVRAQGLKVVPGCSYVATYFDRHPEFADLRA
jgi:predicted GNAT family acetyltransferase